MDTGLNDCRCLICEDARIAEGINENFGRQVDNNTPAYTFNTNDTPVKSGSFLLATGGVREVNIAKIDINNLQFFEDIITRRIELIKQVLVKKGIEYTRGTDRFINFKTSGRRLNITPERALIGMRDKHETSLMDIIDDLDKGILPDINILEEKIGDDINYLILLEGMIKERIAREALSEKKI